MQVLGIFSEPASAAVGENKENADTEEAAGEHDHLAFEERLTNPLVLRGAVFPTPHHPRERLVNASARLRSENRRAERRLILKPGGDVLRRDDIYDEEEEASERRRAPVITAEIPWLAGDAVKVRLFPRHPCASSSAKVLALAALAKFTNDCLGI